MTVTMDRDTEDALSEVRLRALGRAMEPGPEEEALARQFRQGYGTRQEETLEQVWRLDVYRCRRVLVALLDQLSDEQDDEFNRRFGPR